MPIVPRSSYRAPFLLSNGHLQTIIPTLFRKVDGVIYQREQIATPDDDFLDIDWSPVGSDRLGVVAHGLEGSSDRAYVRGMVRQLNRQGWDALAWNFRGCSGETNRKLRSYHSGATDDLDTVIQHVLQKDVYQRIALIGFSMGGNIILKYLGEQGSQAPDEIYRAVVFSAPCHLASSADKISRGFSRVYLKRFLRLLHEKIREKMSILPGQLDDAGYKKIKTFPEFDERYTAPIHEFKDANDYYRRSSSLYYLPAITIPTLIVSAANDPFLTPECFPVSEAKENPHLYLEIPDSGGHVGFITVGNDGVYWSEQRALEFLEQ